MANFLVDTRFHGHPKVARSSAGAIGMWLRVGCWIARTGGDGHIPCGALHMFGPRRYANELVRVGLWEEANDGWIMLREVSSIPGGRTMTLWAVERTDYRRKIPKWLREQVYERDEHACVECGATEDLTLDHIHPWSQGDKDTEKNLRVLCRPCNSRKGARV